MKMHVDDVLRVKKDLYWSDGEKKDHLHAKQGDHGVITSITGCVGPNTGGPNKGEFNTTVFIIVKFLNDEHRQSWGRDIIEEYEMLHCEHIPGARGRGHP